MLNVRPCHYAADLEGLANKLQGGDPYQEQQKQDVSAAEDRVVGGEKLLACSLHVLVRNVNMPSHAPKEQRKGEAVCRTLNDVLPCFRENHAALPIFIACLPLHFAAPRGTAVRPISSCPSCRQESANGSLS